MKFSILVATAATLSFLIGCSRPTGSQSIDSSNTSAIVPGASVTLQADGSVSLMDQMKRYRGQTQFLTPSPYSTASLESAPRAMAAAATSDAGGGARQEQESDIYKVGKAGSKLLYLLNNYRGLQVISFADGADKPKLVSRVKATGNYPDDMYYDEANNRLLVLERLYYSEDGSYNYSDVQSRIVVYDVSNPNAPVVSAEVPVAGSIADSRIVGNVLYIASSIRPDTSYSYGSNDKPQGIVTSFDFSGKTIKEIEKLKLSLPSAYGEKMNIQTVQNADGSYSYYLIAVLSETGWGWGDRKSLVEVVDISDAKGKIKTLMSVSAKGTISERSQTLIKNGTLIVTSNYVVDSAVGSTAERRIARIAVETFGLPKPGVATLTEKEATYRQLHMELALEGKTGAEYDRARETLLSDPALGLKGKFVATKEGLLRKVVSDSVVTVGDTKGMSSSLQDVRYQDGLLYAFWVPANQVDPLDIFDISSPENGVKHLSRLEFDGWVSKAVPMSYGGRNFIVALGWIVPAVDNERNLRHPQASIFEIKKVGAKYKAEQLAQLTFANSNTWTDFNSPDRFIEVRQDGNGKGQILFAASQYSAATYQSGGKILQFDLAQLTSADPEKSLGEGAFLAGKSGWLRRVFTNSEIDRVNTFSDQALGVYNATKAQLDKTVKASAILELARQIRDYQTIKVAGATYGIQLISDWSWYSDDESQTTLRIVDAKTADSETSLSPELKVPGSYIASRVQNGVLYVLTNSDKSERNAKGQWIYTSKSYLHVLQASGSTFNPVSSTEWNTTRQNQTTPPIAVRMRLGRPTGYSSGNFVALPSGAVLVQIDGAIKLATSVGAKDMTLKGCNTKNREELQVDVVGESLYVTSAETVEISADDGISAMRNFVAKAEVSGTTLTCGPEINVPGQLLTVTNGSMLVDDTSMIDLVTKKYERLDGSGKLKVMESKSIKTARALVGLAISANSATLVDEMPKTAGDRYGSPTLKSTRAGELVQLSTFESGASFRPGFRGSFGGRGSQTAEVAFEYIQVDTKGALSSEKFGVELAGSAEARLLGVEKDPSANGKYLALVQSGRKLQVVRWSDTNKRPEVRKLVALNEMLKPVAEADSVPSSNSYYGSKYHFSPEQMSFEIVEGLSGINQFFVK